MSFYSEHLLTALSFAAVAFILGSVAYANGFFKLPKGQSELNLSLGKVLGFFGVYLASMLIIPFALIKLTYKGLFPTFLIQPVSMFACFFFSGCFLFG